MPRESALSVRKRERGIFHRGTKRDWRCVTIKIATTLDEILKNRTNISKKDNGAALSFDDYKRRNGLSDLGGYARAVNALYAASKQGLSSYGINNREISNKGLQNSGYAAYIDDLANAGFDAGLAKIKNSYAKAESDAALSYQGYLDKYRDKVTTLKKSVMSHLVNNGVVDLSTAIAYGMSAGLSQQDAESIGRSAYEVTKQNVFNTVLEQTVRLGLDKEGARMLAVKMGVSEADALSFAEEVEDMLRYYGNVSKEYLEYLEQRSN